MATATLADEVTWKVLGSDEQEMCELCGKENLKGTIALQAPDGGTVRYGSDCAARTMLISRALLNRKVVTADHGLDVEAQRAARRQAPDTVATRWLKTSAASVVREGFSLYTYNDSLDAALHAQYASVKETRGRYPWE